MSTAHFLISFLTFLAVARMAESHISRDEIESKLKRKTAVYNLLCSARRQGVFAKCCKGLKEEIDNLKTKAYYNELSRQCPEPLGMESGIIPDSSITASSFYSADCQPHYARLNRDLGLCAWLPEISPEWSWLQVDFGEKLIVLGLATQGSCRQNYWVKSYFVSYKEEHDALNWLVYTSYEGRPIEFQGNSDQNTVVTNYFYDYGMPIAARYVRIMPLSYTNRPGMRVEYYGCRL